MQKSPFFVNTVYSLGYWLKDYGYYPKNWPLYTYMDHGVALYDKIPPHEINNNAPIIFKFSVRQTEAYKKASKKPALTLLNPTIHCRQKNKISVSPSASGTLFFPAHTTELIDDNTAWDTFIDNLENVPEQFKPLHICLHPTDVRKGLDKIFENRGYPVFCAGSAYEDNFAENFYNILKNYRHTMSNLLGSYVFYSVEMGIPFSLYGEEPKFDNKGDNNIEKGAYTSYKLQPTYQRAVEMFTGFHEVITKQQQDFVTFELGKNNSISRMHASMLLYKAWFQYSVMSVFKRKMRAAFSKIPFLKKGLQVFRFKVANHYNKSEEWTLVNKNYISFDQLIKLKTTSQTSSVLLGKPVQITDAFWYLHSLKEIFAEEVYNFQAGTDTPYILDCGSNIGLSVIYFKRLYPKARVIAFEPDLAINRQLKNNLHVFGFDDVDVQQKAIWTKETTLSFAATGSLGGRVDEGAAQNEAAENIIKVDAVRLKDYLTEKVDFLKIDIEGPELEVLTDCADSLANVQHIFVEYHSDPAKEQELTTILSVLKSAGFRVYIKEAWNNLPYPFLRKNYKPFYDLQLNIFGYRI